MEIVKLILPLEIDFFPRKSFISKTHHPHDQVMLHQSYSNVFVAFSRYLTVAVVSSPDFNSPTQAVAFMGVHNSNPVLNIHSSPTRPMDLNNRDRVAMLTHQLASQTTRVVMQSHRDSCSLMVGHPCRLMVVTPTPTVKDGTITVRSC